MEPTQHDNAEEEASPLLSSYQRRIENDRADTVTQGRIKIRRETVFLAILVLIVILGSGLLSIPALRVLEDIICQRHFGNKPPLQATGSVGEEKCKGDAVQSELSFVVGIQAMVEAVPGLFLAVPYGLLADRIGRRPVLMLSIIGMIIAIAWMIVAMRLGHVLPIWTIWTSAAWQVIGGGSSVMVSMIYSMIADLETPDTRANAFYVVIVSSLVANLIAVPLSSQLMQWSPWVPLLLGLVLVVAGCGGVAFVPETLCFTKDSCL